MAFEHGKLQPGRATVITISGTHGIEGQLGLDIQDEWKPSSGVNWIHVRQLNPQKDQRYNENNVDLNRNNMLTGDEEPEHRDAYRVAAWVRAQTHQSETAARLWLNYYGERGSATLAAEAVMQGQYHDPRNVEYGGQWAPVGPVCRAANPAIWQACEPEHKRVGHELDKLIETHNIDRERCVLVDFHTGCGDPGDGYMLICNDHDSIAKLPASLRHRAKKPYKIVGGLARGYKEKLGLHLGCAMEFATLTTQKDIFAHLLADPHHLPPEMFYPTRHPDARNWQTDSVRQARIALNALAGVTSSALLI